MVGTVVVYTLHGEVKRGVVTSYDADSGFFTVYCDAANSSDELFLGHASYHAQPGAREQRARAKATHSVPLRLLA